MLTLHYHTRIPHADNASSHYQLAPLVLLHGWGSNGDIWQPAISFLQTIFDIISVDMAYQGETAESLCSQLSQQLPPQYHLCGWSLGGMLATTLAAQQPRAVLSLMTLASNMQFVASDHWSDAMERHTYEDFYASVQTDPSRALKRFMSLIVQGDRHAKEQLIFLRQKILPSVDTDGILQGLDILSSVNNTPLLELIHCPAIHVLGAEDSLVPVSVAEKIQTLNSHHQVNVIENSGHLLHVPVKSLMPIFESFYTKNILQNPSVCR